jgi:hypothetical protein
MLPARKEEVFSMESDEEKTGGRLDKAEERLVGLQISVAVLTDQGVRIMADLSELKRDAKDSRARMEDGFQSIRKELSSAKIWALLVAASILGVFARGFHWI